MRQGPRLNTPQCPFCEAPLAPPKQGGIGSGSEFDGGSCGCGAVFGSDPRSNSLGALIIDVLVFACGGDWDLAWELQLGEDYEEAWIHGYHERLHHVAQETPGPRRGVGSLYTVRLKEDRVRVAREKLLRRRGTRGFPPRTAQG